MVDGRASPNCCSPGGVSTAQRVAELLGVKLTMDGAAAELPRVARGDEERCIGCTRCIRKCGSGAVVVGAKQKQNGWPEGWWDEGDADGVRSGGSATMRGAAAAGSRKGVGAQKPPQPSVRR